MVIKESIVLPDGREITATMTEEEFKIILSAGFNMFLAGGFISAGGSIPEEQKEEQPTPVIAQSAQGVN